jgi:hypothetical protein
VLTKRVIVNCQDLVDSHASNAGCHSRYRVASQLPSKYSYYRPTTGVGALSLAGRTQPMHGVDMFLCRTGLLRRWRRGPTESRIR